MAAAHAEGLAEGRRLAEAAMEDERARLAATIAEIAGLRRQVLESVDVDVMELAVGMARRVLHREVQLDPDILLAMARVALGRLGTRVVATAHLHPADLAALGPAPAAPEGLTLAADPDLPRGGCRLVADSGEVDLGIDAQMTELARQLLGESRRVESARLH
jgi:flagellar assembly protein FliH